MAMKTKSAPVSFDELVPELESVLKMIDQFRNGEMLSKNKSEKMLLEYRKTLSRLGHKLAGARLYSFNLESELVPKAVAERDQEPVVPVVEEKVELPD